MSAVADFSFSKIAEMTSYLLLSKDLRSIVHKTKKDTNGSRAFYVMVVILGLKFKWKRTFGCKIAPYINQPESKQSIVRLCDSYLKKRYSYPVAKLKDLLRYAGQPVTRVPASLATYFEKLVDKKLRGSKSKTKFFDPNAAMLALQNTVEQSLKSDIELFMISGTLLGFYRDGGFVNGEYDIDLGFMGDINKYKALENLFLNNSDYEVTKSCKEQLLLVVKYKNISIDIFRHYQRDGLIWHGSTIHEWWNTPFKIAKSSFGKNEFFAPENVEKYLEENYGNWQKPGIYWDFSLDTPNRIYRKNIHALHYLLGRLHRGLLENKSNLRFETTQIIHELDKNFSYDLTGLLPTHEKIKITQSGGA
jgi:hypothetical protein